LLFLSHFIPAELKNLTFCFFSTSFFTQTLNGDIYPAEIAMSKFNLQEGVFDSFHMFVNPGSLPLGMAAEALYHSNITHKRKLPPNIEGETDYQVILDKIMNFLGADIKNKKTIPPLFVEGGMKDEEHRAATLTLEK
jgi:protein maelstrom